MSQKTVFVTQYALSTGVREVPLIDVKYDGKLATVQWSPVGSISWGTGQNYFHKPNWHETHAEAIAHVEKMKVKRIASLKKQLAKIEKIDASAFKS